MVVKWLMMTIATFKFFSWFSCCLCGGIFLFVFLFWDRFSLYSLAGPKAVVETRLASSSQGCSCLCFTNAGTKGMQYHALHEPLVLTSLLCAMLSAESHLDAQVSQRWSHSPTTQRVMLRRARVSITVVRHFQWPLHYYSKYDKLWWNARSSHLCGLVPR